MSHNIGKGAFGSVYLAVANCIGPKASSGLVAVKKLKSEYYFQWMICINLSSSLVSLNSIENCIILQGAQMCYLMSDDQVLTSKSHIFRNFDFSFRYTGAALRRTPTQRLLRLPLIRKKNWSVQIVGLSCQNLCPWHIIMTYNNSTKSELVSYKNIVETNYFRSIMWNTEVLQFSHWV